MNEYMLLIRNRVDAKAGFTPEREQQFVSACSFYIGELQASGNLVSAQPLVREGKLVSGKSGSFSESPYGESSEIIVGYYHIRAGNLDEAISIAKRNPEFAYVTGARIEVRPIKRKEESIGFEYPGQ